MFVIRNGKNNGQLLCYAGAKIGMVGICRFGEAKRFATAAEAEAELSAGIKGAKFYGLHVVPDTNHALGLPPSGFGQNGWMVRNPSYDPVH